MLYKVLQPFVDKVTKERYQVGDEIDITTERADEIRDTQVKHYSQLGAFIELIKNDSKGKRTDKKNKTDD